MLNAPIMVKSVGATGAYFTSIIRFLFLHSTTACPIHTSRRRLLCGFEFLLWGLFNFLFNSIPGDSISHVKHRLLLPLLSIIEAS